MPPNSTRLIKQSYERSLRPHYITGLSTSWLLTPWLLFALRALISLYAFDVLFTRIGRWEQSDDPGDKGDAGRSFSFFTVLSYWGIAFYSAFAAAHTASFALRGKAWLEGWPGWLRFAHGAFYVTVTVFPWVVTGEWSRQSQVGGWQADDMMHRCFLGRSFAACDGHALSCVVEHFTAHSERHLRLPRDPPPGF